MAIVSDRALLLKRYPFGESSLVVHVCTAEHGRVHLLAKGAYRSTSRYFAVLDFLDTLEIEWHESPRRDLFNLRAGSIQVRRRAIPPEPSRWFAATAMLELADLASRPAHPDPGLFELLEDSLDDLQEGAGPSDLVLATFELRFLEILGLAPALDACAACGGKAAPLVLPGSRAGDRIGDRAAFSAGAGGRLCAACAEEARRAGRRVGTLPVKTLTDARALLADGPAAGTALPQERIDRVRDFAGRFLDYHLETRPRTHRAFLSVPNRNAAGETADAI